MKSMKSFFKFNWIQVYNLHSSKIHTIKNEGIVKQYYTGRQTVDMIRSSRPGVFLGKGVLKICSILTGEQPCGSVKLLKYIYIYICYIIY